MSPAAPAPGRMAAMLLLPMALLFLVGLMVVPVSPTILDIGFVANIMISLAVFAFLLTLFALSNLWMARRQLMAMAEVRPQVR